MSPPSQSDEFLVLAHQWLLSLQGLLFEQSLCLSVEIIDTEIKYDDGDRKKFWVDAVITFKHLAEDEIEKSLNIYEFIIDLDIFTHEPKIVAWDIIESQEIN
ncbi:hypothetical protein [Anabaena azotica]|uniref:Uncharacterized protein n=1 Tax=Anabaena azotica FACHB-119 TaxID=947527 RepID=A0ABR8DCI6_9NOST|nr:hypothetical protein [Anabaena azotica]MBD2503932.1 hypothetical protein [Anabaena azotica FACHB-119]